MSDLHNHGDFLDAEEYGYDEDGSDLAHWSLLHYQRLMWQKSIYERVLSDWNSDKEE